MAITMRHGPYNKFDPQKLRTGEIAVVTEGDPHASDGKAIYQCFSPGDVKRMATYEDMLDQIDEAGGDAIDNHIEQKVGTALKACEDATKAAQDAKTNADKAVSSANTAASSADTAAKSANEAAEKALEAVKKCEGLMDNTRVTALEEKMEKVLELLKNVVSTEQAHEQVWDSPVGKIEMVTENQTQKGKQYVSKNSTGRD